MKKKKKNGNLYLNFYLFGLGLPSNLFITFYFINLGYLEAQFFFLNKKNLIYVIRSLASVWD